MSVRWYMSNAGSGGAANPRADVAENTTIQVYQSNGDGKWRFSLERSTSGGWSSEILFCDYDLTFDNQAQAKRAAARWFAAWILARSIGNTNSSLTSEKVEEIQEIWGTENQSPDRLGRE